MFVRKTNNLDYKITGFVVQGILNNCSFIMTLLIRAAFSVSGLELDKVQKNIPLNKGMECAQWR